MSFFIHNFGKNISRLRREKGLTQDELAKSIGVQKAAISKIELGVSYPTFSNLDKIAQFFNATPNQLFGTPTQIELENSVLKTDTYSDKAKIILSALEKLELSHEEKYFDDVLWLVRGAQIFDKDGSPLYEDYDGRITSDPTFARGYAYHQSPLEHFLSKEEKIKELVEDIAYIKKNSNLLEESNE